MLTKEQLLATRVIDNKVDLPCAGGQVLVTGLTRRQIIDLSDITENWEAHFISAGLVDPKMTVDEVAEWQKTAPAGDLQEVSNRIYDLSGMGKTRAKELYKRVREESNAGI